MKNNVDSYEIVFDLLYFALINIREEGRLNNDSMVYMLSDLFHVVPKMLCKVEQGQKDYESVLAYIRERAQEKGMGKWVESNISQIERNQALT